MKKKVLIVGLGSIGLRHQKILRARGVEVFTVSRSQEADAKTIAEFLGIQTCDLILICTESSSHYKNLSEIREAGYQSEVVVEKPLFSEYLEHPLGNTNPIFVAFNQRFNPGLKNVYSLIKDEKVIQAQAYVGQHLSTWRKNRPYSESYSADKKQGGGVLRDLCHELDYCLWLFGDVHKLYALGGKFSDLSISSDDSQAILLSQEKCPMTQITLNYLDHETKRTLNIVTNNKTIYLDFIKNELKVNGEVTSLSDESYSTYEAQWDALLGGDGRNNLCTYKEGLRVNALIAQIERFQTEDKK